MQCTRLCFFKKWHFSKMKILLKIFIDPTNILKNVLDQEAFSVLHRVSGVCLIS